MSATRKNAARRKNPLSDDLEEGGFEARVQAAAHRLQAGQTEEEVEADLVLHHGVDGPMAMLIARAARVLLSEWEPRSERDTKPDMRAAKPAPKASQGRVLLGPTDDQVLQAIDSHTGAFVDMMPVDFLRLTTVDEDHVRKVQSEAHSIDKYEKHMAEGKCEIHPFLRIDTKSGQVVGHDGRHRAAAILSADPDAHMRVALIPVPLSKSASMADIPETIKGEYDPGFRIKIRNNVTVVDDNVQQGCASCGKPAKERKDLFEDTVLRRDKKGQIHLMNHPAKGWASYGIPYASEQDVLDEWNVTIDPWTTDKYGDVAKVRKVRMGNPVGKSRVDPVAPTPLATFRNDETGMETYVHSGQNGTFNVTMRDLDSGEWVPGARVGIKSLDEATRVASKWAGAGARRENPVARAPKAPPDAWSALGLRKPKELPPEKLATLLPKLRKGADASLTMGQLVAVAWHLGWRVEPVALVVPSNDHMVQIGNWNNERNPDLVLDGGDTEAFAESQRAWRLRKALPERPTHLAPGETAIYNVSPLRVYADGRAAFSFGEVVGIVGIRFTDTRGVSKEAFPNSYDRRCGRSVISMPPHEIMRWVRAESSWKDDINHALGTEPHRPSEPRTRENTATCWDCWRNIKLDQDGRLVHHGFQRPGDGQIHGDCLGVGTLPYEVSRAAGERALASWRITLSNLQETIAAYKSGGVKEIRSGTWQREVIFRPSDADGWAEREDGNVRWVGKARWQELIEVKIRQYEQQASDAAGEVKLYEHALRTWQVRPLPGTPGAPETEFAHLRRMQTELMKIGRDDRDSKA